MTLHVPSHSSTFHHHAQNNQAGWYSSSSVELYSTNTQVESLTKLLAVLQFLVIFFTL